MVARHMMKAAALAAGLFAAATAAQADCKFQKIAELPVTMEGMRPVIDIQVNGKNARFIVDTGAFFSGVTDAAGERFAMKHSTAPFGMTASGIGGQVRDVRAMRADTVTFAGVGFRNMDFITLPRMDEGISGLIGENLMGPFDVEYDFANGVIRYFKPEGCGYSTNLAYWSKGMALSKLSMLDINPGASFTLKVITSAKVDGHTIHVQWDSGAGVSLVSRAAAAKAGITVNSAGVVEAGVGHGVQGRGLEYYRAPFQSFAIGDEEIKNTQLFVTNSEINPGVDMLLGPDFFLSHRVLISNSQKAVYFTYNGGSVFRLDSQPQRQAAAAPPASPTAPGGVLATSDQEPTTASEFARRGAARTSRRDFANAVADYTQAITLEPDNGAYYRARGMARLQARQPVLAMADLDEALKRQPNDPEALLRRGELYLASRDTTRARADFEQAIKLAPDRPDLPALIGQVYVGAGQYDLATAQLDGWLAAHPKDENVGQILTARCYARAASGKELDKALADCDQAVRKDSNSRALQTRALVLLRLNRLDEAIAQYTAALKAQPRDAAALYGRGLAEARKGDKAASDADIATATGIAQNVGIQFKRMGLEPGGAAAPAKS
ncbi:MAG: tetratricopeptide repeat protein [Proteobacteria bacterium]|nr:tetratricopeptide repeat protein [Pseudomonadota bacterium]